MNWITEERYEERMKEEVDPYLDARRETGYFERVKNEPIYFEHFKADAPKGVIVISHGFTESVKKFNEATYYMLQAGYEVWGVDHRGHGLSVRQNDNPYVVFVEKFDDYILDLKWFVENKVKPASKGLPLYLYCHSMGGCIGARLIEEAPELFTKAVLSSPMLGLDFGMPIHLVYIGATPKGMGENRKKPLAPVTSFPADPDFEGSCDSSECRYMYYWKKRIADVKLQTTDAAINWGKEAIKACYQARSKKNTAKIKIPVLLCQAGNDTVVKNASQDEFLNNAPTAEKYFVPGMKHELYMTDSPVLIPYWEKIFSFLG